MEKVMRLTPKEKLFCCYYVSSGNCKEAAACAGFRNPEQRGNALLARDDVNAEIHRLFEARNKNYRQQARAGYERLAFGNVTDAVRLMFADDPDMSSIASLDLFNVAEIKRPKDGALEIKFFDRIKALEKLESADKEETSSVSEFYKALADCGSSENGKGGQCEIQEIF